MKKKGIIILIVVLLVLAGAAGAIYYVLHNKKASNEELVYATKISDLNGGYDLTESRYMGTVESQEVKGVNRVSARENHVHRFPNREPILRESLPERTTFPMSL